MGLFANPIGYIGLPPDPTTVTTETSAVRAATITEANAGTLTDCYISPATAQAAAVVDFASPPAGGFGSTTPRPVASTTLTSSGVTSLATAATTATLNLAAAVNSVPLTVNIATGSSGDSSTVNVLSSAATAGTSTLNLNTGTGAITRNTNIGTGAAVINGVNIGGTGANVIAIADTQTAGSVSVGSGMTTGTIRIGGTGAQTGTVTLSASTGAQAIDIANTVGVKTIGIGNGVSGNAISIGNGINTSAQTIAIANAASAANTEVDILCGIGSAGAGVLKMANNTRVTTIDLGNIAPAATRTTTVLGGNSAQNDVLGILGGDPTANAQSMTVFGGVPSGGTQTVGVFTGNASGGTQTVNVLTGTRAGVANIATGAAVHELNLLSATGKLGTFGAATVVRQLQGALTNNVTVGGTTGIIADITDLTVYGNAAADIRNDIYQLGLALSGVITALRNYGLLS